MLYFTTVWVERHFPRLLWFTANAQKVDDSYNGIIFRIRLE